MDLPDEFDAVVDALQDRFGDRVSIAEDRVTLDRSGPGILTIRRDGRVHGTMPLHDLSTAAAESITIENDTVVIATPDTTYRYTM